MKTQLQGLRNQNRAGSVCEPAHPEVRHAGLDAEELEAVIAPGTSLNHNETFLGGTVELKAEELEAVIVPRIAGNHNETFLG